MNDEAMWLKITFRLLARGVAYKLLIQFIGRLLCSWNIWEGADKLYLGARGGWVDLLVGKGFPTQWIISLGPYSLPLSPALSCFLPL